MTIAIAVYHRKYNVTCYMLKVNIFMPSPAISCRRHFVFGLFARLSVSVRGHIISLETK